MPPSYQKTLAIISPNLLRQTEAIIESSSLAILNEKQVQLTSDQVHQFLQEANSNEDPKSANSVHNHDQKSANFVHNQNQKSANSVHSEDQNSANSVHNEDPKSANSVHNEEPKSDNSVHNTDQKSTNSVHSENLKSALTSGPVHVLIIGGLGAVTRWLELIGQVDQANCISVLYGSADIGAARRDVRFFFPGTLLEVDYSRSAREYLSEALREVLVKGLVSMSKAKPENPVLWLGMWLLENKPHEM